MNYAETLSWLYSQLPLFSRIGAAAYKKDLTNTITLCKAVGNPQDKVKTIHIAGTNGKGSTSHMLAAILQQSGYKTGLYTSPHLKDFRERIKINGVMIDVNFIVEFVENIKSLTEEIKPSFFEVTVAMAFDYFEKEKVDIAVIETGLGGRLDSTNIIHPLVSIITNIGYDHMNILGDTLEEIAAEKAGIIKNNTPVVIGKTQTVVKDIFIAAAKEKNAPLIFADEKYKPVNIVSSINQLQVTYESSGNEQTYLLDLNGTYQAENLATVLTTTDILNDAGYNIAQKNISKAVANVKAINGLHGRWDLIGIDPVTVLDVAHNQDGIEQLVNQINSSAFEKLHIIFGMVNDKDTTGVLSQLPLYANYYFTKAQIPRAMDEQDLKAAAAGFGLMGESYPEVNKALAAARDAASASDLIIVCGSVFLVGEVNLPVHSLS